MQVPLNVDWIFSHRFLFTVLQIKVKIELKNVMRENFHVLVGWYVGANIWNLSEGAQNRTLHTTFDTICQKLSKTVRSSPFLIKITINLPKSYAAYHFWVKSSKKTKTVRNTPLLTQVRKWWPKSYAIHYFWHHVS
jgi:hypothetical protein